MRLDGLTMSREDQGLRQRRGGSAQAEDDFEPRRAAREQEEQSEGSGSQTSKSGKSGAKPRKPLAVRILLFILRKSIVPLILLVALIAGMYAGYVVLGKGPETDVFEWGTWRHMYDLIFSDS